MGVAAVLWTAEIAHAGSARDYLNAPVDSWLLNYNAGYTTSLTPEDGADLVPGVRANVLAQSVVLTRVMDYWGRTGGFSLVLPYALIDTSAGPDIFAVLPRLVKNADELAEKAGRCVKA